MLVSFTEQEGIDPAVPHGQDNHKSSRRKKKSDLAYGWKSVHQQKSHAHGDRMMHEDGTLNKTRCIIIADTINGPR